MAMISLQYCAPTELQLREIGRRKPSFVRCSSAASPLPAAGAGAELDAKVFRHNFMRRKDYNRTGFGHHEETLQRITHEYAAGENIIEKLKENGYEYSWGEVSVKLAEAHGICWGVDRALRIAYEARKQFPTHNIWLNNEIIHNPTVNQKLEEMGVRVVPVKDGKKQFDLVEKGDVVVLSAFGAPVDEMKVLTEKNVEIVDTTCPWVSKVWHTVEKHKKGEYTSIIHGKYGHEETVATASFAGKFIIVLDMEEATYLCDYILGGGVDGSSSSKEAFLQKFKHSISKGFDPDKDLDKVGIANQTTMLKRETENIVSTLSATELKSGKMQLRNWWRTGMLIRSWWLEDGTPATRYPCRSLRRNVEYLPSYWVDTDKRIGPGNRITYKLMHGELVEKEEWVPKGPIKIGIAAGASTPNKVIEDVILKVLGIKRDQY